MATRNSSSQTLHDLVIQKAYDSLDKISHNVYKNPGSSRNIAVNGYYPDIVITKIGSNIVEFIIEVETIDSITANEIEQWKKFSTLCSNFFLLVPTIAKQRITNLCIQKGIKVKVGTFSLNSNGNILISYE